MDLNLINIYDSAGQELDMSRLGLTGLKLSIPSPSYNVVTERVEGSDELIVVESNLKPRNLIAEFYSKAISYEDSLNLRDNIYNLLGNGQYFYISESTLPFKRWKVYLEDGWTPRRFDVKIHLFEIPLTAMSGTSESIDVVEEVFLSSPFSFNNEGTKSINPRVHSETEIEFIGASTDLTITNTTTGDEWKLNDTTVSGDKVLLKGVRTLKNDVSVLGKTNKKLITFNPGWNNFEVTGATGGFVLYIRTRFYFL